MRVHLVAVASEVPAGSSVEFAFDDGDRTHQVDSVKVSRTAYRLDVNVTNFRHRKQIPDGSWRVVAYVDGRPLRAAECAGSLSAMLASRAVGFCIRTTARRTR